MIGFLGRFLRHPARTLRAALSGLANPAEWLTRLVSPGTRTQTGATVTRETAIQNPTLWACVRIIGETLGMLPLPLYERRPDGGKTKAREHPLYRLLNEEANEEMDGRTYREIVGVHLALCGNSISQIVRNSLGQPIALWPIRPDLITIGREGPADKPGELLYQIKVGSETRYLRRRDVLHISGPGYDGVRGYNPIDLLREPLGIAQASAEFAARFYERDASSGVVLTYPRTLNEKARKNLVEAFESIRAGLAGVHKTAVLENGLDIKPYGFDPRNSQLIEARKFQSLEIARAYRMQPHLIGDLDRATFSNIEHSFLEFVILTMMPWCTRLEAALNRQLLEPEERSRYFWGYQVNALMRGDTRTRFQAYSIGRQWGFFSANDVLELEDRNTIGRQGDVYLSPLNMIDAGELARGLDDDTGEALEEVSRSLAVALRERAHLAQLPGGGNGKNQK